MEKNEKKSLFVSCAPTLEPLVIDELKELGLESVRTGYCGVFVDEWTWNDIYRINYASRLASRVLIPLIHFRCFDRHTLYRKAMEINWGDFIKERNTFAIDANVQHRELRNSLFAAQVVKDAICDQMRNRTGRRPSVKLQQPDVQINLFIHNQDAVISFDCSGDPLHKRGYRQESVEAPIQESLAAAILRLAEYNKEKIFLDPCCGSGTLLIEAALIASQTPPGYLRQKWGFMKHPEFVSMDWLKIRNQLDEKRVPLADQHLFGVDRSKSAVRACKINFKAAGFSQQIHVEEGDFRELEPLIAPDFIMTNPPHGRRLEETETLIPLYRALGDFIKKNCKKPGKGFVFTSNLELTKEVGLAAKKKHVLSNSGIDSRLLEYEIF